MEEKLKAVHQILQDDWYVVVCLDPSQQRGWYMGDIPDDEAEAYRLFCGVFEMINRTYKAKFNKDLITPRSLNKNQYDESKS